MERLAEQIVDWHNRHPLARRIGTGDIHTIGVVALPFVRASAQAGGLVEPVLTDAVSFDELAAGPPVSRGAVWLQRLAGLAGKLARRGPRTQWRAFSEKFLPGLSPDQVERFALAHGFAEPPASPESQPWRVVVIDEALAGLHGGWPFELYLMSAGIDVGSARTRVLGGRGIPSEILGRRLWDPRRLGLAGAVLALLVAVGGYALWPRHEVPPAVDAAAAPAEAASAVAATPASAVAGEPASPPAPQAEAASAPGPEASTPEAAPAVAASELPEQAGSQPDIRPHLVQRADGVPRPPLLSSGKLADKAAEKADEKTAEKAASKAADKAADKAAERAAEKPAAERSPGKAPETAQKAAAPAKQADRTPEPADPRLARLAEAPAAAIVALVGPPGSKAEAEALLKRMKAGLVGVHSNPDALQGDVIQTPEGWRATVWPFPSREQAQLINATLVARGMKTRAVNF
jgi:hypothetical protein